MAAIKMNDYYLFDANAEVHTGIKGVFRVVAITPELHEVVLEDVETLEFYFLNDELVKHYGMEY